MFWQSSFLSALHSLNVIKDTKYMNAEDINTGLAALLQTFEMVLFAFLHVRCFSYIPYRKDDRTQMTLKGPSLAHALNFGDFWRETRDGAIYMWRKMRGKEAELEARRRTHFERAMGKSRTVTEPKKGPVEPHGARGDESDEEDMEIPSRLLLGTREEQPWTLENEKASVKRREKFDGKQSLLPVYLDEGRGHEPRQHSWWTRMYGRLSTEDPESLPSQRRQASGGPSNIPIHSFNARIREHALRVVDLDDPPPPSLLGRGHKRGRKSGHADSDDPSGEKQPFVSWNPSVTLPPRPSDKGIILEEHSPKALPVQSNVGKEKMKPNGHEKEDSMLGRIFAHTPEQSVDERTTDKEKQRHGLPSLFQRKEDIANMVKGWSLPILKSPADAPPVPAKEEDIPSIPSLSPSPPARPKSNGLLDVLARTSPPVPTPAQPVPVLHDSLSRARRPGVLIADEAGVSPPAELINVQRWPRGRVEKWVEGTRKQLDPPHVAPPPNQRLSHRPVQSMGSMPPPVDSMRYRSYGAKGPKKPAKIILPTPLSPARWPGGPQQPNPYVPREPPSMSRLPPGAAYGPNPPYGQEFGFQRPPSPSQFYGTAQPLVSRSRNMAPNLPTTYQFNPYEQFGPPGFEAPTRQDPNERPSRGRRREQRQVAPQVASSRPRSQSPFGIIPAQSEAESLPRHPALRQQTARRRRESQPPPETPPQVAQTGKQTRSKRPRRRSDPLQSSYNADKSSSPPISPAMLLNSATAATSPTSPLGDSRYPRATSRENYFDPYDTVSPYLTTIMNDPIPPPAPVSTVSGPTSPARRTKRR